MEKMLIEHGIKPTANRLLVLKALADSHRPVTMSELEDAIDTIDKSGIFRTLTLFKGSDQAMAMIDPTLGRGQITLRGRLVPYRNDDIAIDP